VQGALRDDVAIDALDERRRLDGQTADELVRGGDALDRVEPVALGVAECVPVPFSALPNRNRRAQKPTWI
jgi:hypothetical protein